jgi:hypothetical protein
MRYLLGVATLDQARARGKAKATPLVSPVAAPSAGAPPSVRRPRRAVPCQGGGLPENTGEVNAGIA